MKQRTDHIPTIWFIFSTLLSTICLGIYIWGGMEALDWEEVSELIPQTVSLFPESREPISSTIFLVRQHYYVQTIAPNFWPMVIGGLMAMLGLAWLGQFIQVWSKVSWRQILLGLFLWVGILFLRNSNLEIGAWLSFFHSPWICLAFVSMALLTVLSSSAIPSFLLEISHSPDKKSSQKKFTGFMLFYGINLILSMGNLWGMWTSTLYVPAFIIFEISMALGMFRILRYESPLNQKLFGALFLLSHSVLIPILWNNNEVGIRAIESWTLMTHLSMAILYPVFLWTNFKEPIQNNLPIYKVVHKAHFIPIYLIQIGVFILCVSWVFARQGTAWHQVVAAYYNEQGDVEHFVGDRFLEELAYKNSMIHSKLNQKSNLSLARISQAAGDTEKQAYYLQTSQIRHPREKSFVALANIYGNENQWFESLFTLKKAYQLFPQSSQIATQLSRVYEQIKQIDSAAYYLVLAKELAPKNSINWTNLMYFDVRHGSKLASKEDLESWSLSRDHAVQSNLLARFWNNKKELPANFAQDTKEAQLDVRDFALLFNASLFFQGRSLVYPIQNYLKDPQWLQKFPEIAFLDAWQDYYHQHPLRALNKLDLLMQKENDIKAQEYRFILSHWKKQLLEVKAKVKLNNVSQALAAIQSYPFSLGILQQALPLLHQSNKHQEAYQATLAAIQWNEDRAEFYPLYILEAFQQGEISYAEEAMNQLKKLDPILYQSHATAFVQAKEKALKRQKFN
ncbi:tetratricopeptide repeat protein [Aquirufa sp. OSTEICH-129A]